MVKASAAPLLLLNAIVCLFISTWEPKESKDFHFWHPASDFLSRSSCSQLLQSSQYFLPTSKAPKHRPAIKHWQFEKHALPCWENSFEMHIVFYLKYFVKLQCGVAIYSALYTLLLTDSFKRDRNLDNVFWLHKVLLKCGFVCFCRFILGHSVRIWRNWAIQRKSITVTAPHLT